MHPWNYTPDHPITLTLAADARLTQTSYIDDQIWEFKLGSSEPRAVCLETTFGLRARLCRIFPRFITRGKEISDPTHFSHPILFHQYYANYLSLSFKPFSTINVRLEYWVPGSRVIAARIKIQNTGNEAQVIQMEWAEILNPASEGTRMAINELELKNVLSGKTADLVPVLYISGSVQPGKSPYPSLSSTFEIGSHREQEVQWVHVSLSELSASFSLAKEVINKNWDAEFARIKQVNSNQLDIQTGNKEWDTAILLSQTIAHQLIIKPDHSIGRFFMVNSRRPDQGYSLRRDGSDYSSSWNGQTTLEANYLINTLLPSSAEFIPQFLDHYLESQGPDGYIDNKPGIIGQPSRLLATPILATLAMQYSEYMGNLEYLKLVLPKLLAFYQVWLSKAHDRDEDHLPEWDHPSQTGFEELPLFSTHFLSSSGIDTATIEGADLGSYLYRECQSLIKLAYLTGNQGVVKYLEAEATILKAQVEQTWCESEACYQYRDRDSHLTSVAEILCRLVGPGVIDIQREFVEPVRPHIRIESSQEISSQTQIYIHGSGVSGGHRIEHISFNHIRWYLNTGFVTSEYTYKVIERVEIIGNNIGDAVTMSSIQLTSLDLCLMLPLWAGIPEPERAKILTNLTIMNKKKFLSPYGLRSYVNNFKGDNVAKDYYTGLHIPWIAQVMEGLVRYGERKKAAEVFSRVMKSVLQSIKIDTTLHQSYQCETGKPLGAQNALIGLLPIHTFLIILGVKILSPSQVEISGHNPFPWPVTVKYKGVTVVRHARETIVIFPDRQTVSVENGRLQIVAWDKHNAQVDNPVK